MFEFFKEVGLEVCCVFFFVVMEFFKLFKDEEFLCRIGKILCYVINMNFINLEGVILVLRYCKDDGYFLEKFFGFFLFFI